MQKLLSGPRDHCLYFMQVCVVTFGCFTCVAGSKTLKVEAACFSETSVTVYQSAYSNIPEDCNLRQCKWHFFFKCFVREKCHNNKNLLINTYLNM